MNIVAALFLFAADGVSAPDSVAIVRALSEQRFADVSARFDPQLRAAMSDEHLAENWIAFVARVGKLVELKTVTREEKAPYRVDYAHCVFERALMRIKLVFAKDGAVVGLFFLPPDLQPNASRFLEHLHKRHFADAAAMFGPQMKGALSAEQLQALWDQLEAQRGAFVSAGDADMKESGAYRAALVPCRFRAGELTVKIVFDAMARVEGLFFLPPTPEWSAPPYVDANAFDERAVTVKAAVDLPGVVSVPKGKGPFPAVVLVHGSGPADADETIGAVKVFKDIAQGLASKGVVVLRYAKITKVAPLRPVRTVEDEVIDGARAAIAFVRGMPEVDTQHVLLVGHSQGGYLAPRIAASVPGITRLAMLAAPARPLETLVQEQLAYLTKDEALHAAAKRFAEQVRSPALKADDDVASPARGTTKGSYYLDLRGYDPVAAALAFAGPLLIVQGGRDYQVSLERDYAVFERALAKRPLTLLKAFPALNHAFVAGEGASTPADYERGGHVDVDVINVLGVWANPSQRKVYR